MSSCTGKKDSCFISITDEIIIIEDIVSSENSVFLVRRLFQKINDFYTYPLPSSILGIVFVSEINENLKILPISEIKAKCWLMPGRCDFFYVCHYCIHFQFFKHCDNLKPFTIKNFFI